MDAAAMKKNPYKKPPFSIDRKRRGDLARQIADGLRTAIATGFYKPGDIIPPVRDLGEILGVSMGIAVQAVAMIREEGLISPRPAQGSVVCDRGEKLWRGHVVFVGPAGDDNYFQSVFAGVLRDRFVKAGYLYTPVSHAWTTDGVEDFSVLKAALAQSVDAVVALLPTPAALPHLRKCKRPFIAISKASAVPGAGGLARIDYNPASDEFAAECRRLGVEEFVEFYWARCTCMNYVSAAFRRAGIRVKRIKVEADTSSKPLEVLKRAGYLAFERECSQLLATTVKPSNCQTVKPSRRGRAYFFADDYLASGALLALSQAGLEAPRDIRIATWANSGLGPVYHRELARLEMDPVDAGSRVAEGVLEYLKTGVFPTDIVIGPRFFKGETL